MTNASAKSKITAARRGPGSSPVAALLAKIDPDRKALERRLLAWHRKALINALALLELSKKSSVNERHMREALQRRGLWVGRPFRLEKTAAALMLPHYPHDVRSTAEMLCCLSEAGTSALDLRAEFARLRRGVKRIGPKG